jgi:predicted amidophosphoribosyltransferase
VMTTGATLNECARMLKKAGTRTVWAVTAGRGV